MRQYFIWYLFDFFFSYAFIKFIEVFYFFSLQLKIKFEKNDLKFYDWNRNIEIYMKYIIRLNFAE